MIATMFLRWHWFVDVLAGLVLAFSARALAVAITAKELERAEEDPERQAVWETLKLWRRG